MGDPKFPHKTYSTPRHPWQKERIDSEKEILKKFGLKNKRELWKGMEMLKSFRSQARDLQARMRANDPNAEKQFLALIQRLGRYDILAHNASLDDVLSLTIEDILSRRLQTIVFRKNLARTPKQARQMITHGHVTMNGRRVTVPGMLVEGQLEETIIYHDTSPFTDELHPVRQVILNGPSEVEEQVEEEVEESAPTGGRPPRSRERGYPRRDTSRGREPRKIESKPVVKVEKQEKPLKEPSKEEQPKKETKQEPPKEEKKVEGKKAEEKKTEPVKEEKPKTDVAAEKKPVKEETPPAEEEPKKAPAKKVTSKEGTKEEAKPEEKPKKAEKAVKETITEEKPKKTPKKEAVVKEETSVKPEKPKKAAAKKTTASKPKETKPKEEKKKEETKEGEQ